MTIRDYVALGDTEKIKSLIAAGLDVNTKNRNGGVALHGAAWSGHREIAELLIQNGADVNIQDNGKTTPLWLACERGKKDVVELLLAIITDLPVELLGCTVAESFEPCGGLSARTRLSGDGGMRGDEGDDGLALKLGDGRLLLVDDDHAIDVTVLGHVLQGLCDELLVAPVQPLVERERWFDAPDLDVGLALALGDVS